MIPLIWKRRLLPGHWILHASESIVKESSINASYYDWIRLSRGKFNFNSTLKKKRNMFWIQIIPSAIFYYYRGLWLKLKRKDNSSIPFKAKYLDHFTRVISTMNKCIYWRLKEEIMGNGKRWFCIPANITSLVMEIRTIIDKRVFLYYVDINIKVYT